VAELESLQQSDAIRTALLRLPPHYRAVVELRHFQELSYAEIAAALDLPVSDVKSHLFRARKLLAQHLAPNL
jgi:RNA polymerase sigma-70 factor (ECF subfamily)